MSTSPSSPTHDDDLSFTPDSTTTITKPSQEEKINILDLNSIKCAIDDQVIKSLEYSGELHENHTLTNIKIILGLIAVVAAVYAYFEDNVWLTASLCALYICISIALQLMGWIVQGHAFFVSAAYKGQVVRATGYIREAYSTTYVLVLETYASQGALLKNFSFRVPKDGETRSSKNNYLREEIHMEITNIFDAEGNMEKTAVAQHVDAFLERFNEVTLKKQ